MYPYHIKIMKTVTQSHVTDITVDKLTIFLLLILMALGTLLWKILHVVKIMARNSVMA
jgi:hypothetical protein